MNQQDVNCPLIVKFDFNDKSLFGSEVKCLLVRVK